METILLEFIATLDYSLKKQQMENFSQLTISQFQYIDAIATMDNPTISEVAARLGFTKASATTAINKLAALGLVDKTQSEADKRVFHVGFKEVGKRLVQAKAKTIKDYVDFVASSLEEAEIEQFVVILSKLVEQFRS